MKFLVPLTIMLSVLVAVACGGDSPGTTPSPLASDPVGKGGGSPPTYSNPVSLRDGDYWPADFPFASVSAQGELAAAQDAQKPAFEGTIEGIRLYSFAHVSSDPSVDRKWCVVDRFPVSAELSVNYVPAGTFANGPAYAGICEDGSVSFVEQSFTTKHGSFDVVLYSGEAAFGHDASTSRVHSEAINGVDGVVIDPLTKEGFGRGWASYATIGGVLLVDGRNLPSSGLVKIVGGVSCSTCRAFTAPDSTYSTSDKVPGVAKQAGASPNTSYNVTLTLYHPSGSSSVNEQLTCGWHNGICPDTGPPGGGPDLDWQPTDCSGGDCHQEAVWVRWIGYGGETTRTWVAREYTYSQETPCKQVRSDVERIGDYQLFGIVHQLHTKNDSPSHGYSNLFASTAGVQSSTISGSIIPHLSDNCKNTGDHTHQFYESGPYDSWWGQNSVSVYNTCNYGVLGQPCGSPFPIWNTYEYAVQFATG